MGMRGWSTAVLAAALVAAPATARAETFEANANGNPFTGGLSFEPVELTLAVGDTVRWTNTDSFVPHTVTEDNRLFDLAGDYGIPGAMGFGPGESVEWTFAAGGWSYFCEIHPEMVGRIDAPVALRVKGKKRKRKRRVVARWAAEELPEGQVFDVERSVNGRRFKTVEDGTRELTGRFKTKRGKEVAFRSRVRLESDLDAASDYSPPTEIKVR